MTGLRDEEYVVEATEKHRGFMFYDMRKYTEHLFRNAVFFDSVMVIKPRLRAPTNVESAVYVRFAPFHNFAKFLPIVHFFKRHMFDGRARNDHSVEITVFYVLERFIKGQQMLLRDVFRLMGGRVNKLHFNLQRSVSQKSGKLRLRFDFLRHQVENEYF